MPAPSAPAARAPASTDLEARRHALFLDGYLLVAALVTPRSSGESTSPLLGLAVVVPFAYVAATFSAAGRARPSPLGSVALAVLHGGAVVAAAIIVLAVRLPALVPGWLRSGASRASNTGHSSHRSSSGGFQAEGCSSNDVPCRRNSGSVKPVVVLVELSRLSQNPSRPLSPRT